MWIVPNNLKTSITSPYVPVSSVSKEDWKQLFPTLSQSLMWRSKPSPYSTWYQRWNRVWWLQHLFGRILRPSTHNHFVTEYTASLEVIPANPLACRASKKAQPIPDTCTLIWKGLSAQLDLFAASSKTSPITSILGSTKFTKAYAVWATQLKRDYTARLKSMASTSEKDYSSWQCPTCFNSLWFD